MRVASARGDIEEGEVIGGRYRVTGLLGQGGFGTVYDCVHVTTGHPVAVKVLSERTTSEEDELHRRFYQEAATTSRLSHPNTVRVFDFGETDGGYLFLAMERLDGETLQDVLAANHRADRVMPDAEAANVGVAVLRSLGEAHAHGLVHRDMKPANIFLHEVAGGDRIVKVLDFGIVKDVDASMTQAGKALGTPTHMSPEQAMGTPVDARTDLYALGVVLYECVTGTLPFWAENPLAIVMQHVTEALEPINSRAPGKVRPSVAAVIEKSLAKMPDGRWADAQEMRTALQRAVNQLPSGAFETLGRRADKEEFKTTSPATLTPRTVHVRPGAVGGGVTEARDGNRPRRDTQPRSGQPSSIKVNIPGVAPVQVRTGEQRVYSHQEEGATAFGVPAMGEGDGAPSQDPNRPTRLDMDVDAPTQVLDADQLRHLSESDMFNIASPPPPIPAPPSSATAAAPAEPETVVTAQPETVRTRRDPEPPPVPITAVTEEPDPPALDSAVLTVGEDFEPEQDPDQPELSPSPMAIIDRYERSAPPRPTIPRGPGGGMPDVADLMRAAGLFGGPGNSGMFSPGDVLGARLSADLKRMTQQLRDRTGASPSPRRAAVTAMWIGPDATTAIYGSGQGDVRLVHLDDVTETPVTLSTARDDVEVGGHDDMVAAVTATPDGRYVISGSVDGFVRCWNPADGATIGELDVESRVAALALSTDGRLCVIGTDDGQLRLCKVPELTIRREMGAHGSGVTAVDAASSRRLAASGGQDGLVRTWDPVGGGARLTKKLHDEPVGAVAISRDRRLVASGGWDGRVIVFSASDGTILHELDAHDDVVSGVAFCADGEFLATVSDDRAARIWRIDDGSVVGERDDFEAAPKAIRFASDNSCVYIGAWDGTVRRMAILPLF